MIRDNPPFGDRLELNYQFVSNQDEITHILEGVLSDLALSQAHETVVAIVLAEVINNVIEHAYTNAENRPVELTIEKSPAQLRCTVVDQGCPMPGPTLPKGEMPDISGGRDTLPEGGFGWLLIRKLARNISYSRCGNENRLAFMVSLPDPE